MALPTGYFFQGILYIVTPAKLS